jgi:RHS repeat-associated protein
VKFLIVKRTSAAETTEFRPREVNPRYRFQTLVGNSWYDSSGNLLQQINPGDGIVFTKSAYNGANWVTSSYRGYNPSGTSFSQAGTVANDIIVEQTIPAYDEVGNVISQASYQRLNDAPSSGTGSTGALSYASDPKARVSYTAGWFDGIDRNIAAANYGAIASFTRPSTAPASGATVLVNQTAYNEAGQPSQTTDPNGVVNQTTFDAAGRKTQTVEDYGTGLLNRTTNWTYTLDNLIATLTAVNATTGDQTTTYAYGSDTTFSGVARKDLLESISYPDSVSGSDVVSYTYNRQGQPVNITDQRGTNRTLLYDPLGRVAYDGVTYLGGFTDPTVMGIGTTYEARGMVQSVTSYDNPTPGAGNVLNQCLMAYNSFGQLIEEQQNHSGAVKVSTPGVQYSYDSGASNSNEIRLNGLVYPNGRVLTYNFASGVDSSLNRVTSISDTSATLAGYAYLGLGTVVRITYPQPEAWLDLWGGTSGTFNGLDQFNRVTDQRWQNSITGTPADIDRYQYGYDQDSNRLYKANVVGTPIVTGGLDEFYAYDHLNRLTQMQRGTLNGTKTSITGTPTVQQSWTLDPTGNWPQFVTQAGGTTDLNQSRTSNTVNEITSITESTGPTWVVPAYDPAGNTTTMPQVVDPTQGFAAVYDAWNRLITITDAGTSETVAIYSYDGRNRRNFKITYSGGVPVEGRTFYFTDNWQDIEERVGTSTSMDKQYVWGIRYVDELVGRDDATPQRLYACQDANFNLTAITDTSGAVEERYLFDPYANRTILNSSWGVISSSSYDEVIGYQGLTLDVESGLVQNRLRILHPPLGRFTCRDLLKYKDGPSLYGYVSGNPVIHVDPFGTDKKSDCMRTASRNSEVGNFRCDVADQNARKECATLKADVKRFAQCLHDATQAIDACNLQVQKQLEQDKRDCDSGKPCKAVDCSKQASPCFDARDAAFKKCGDDAKNSTLPPAMRTAELTQCEADATASLAKCLTEKGCAK